MAANSQYVVPRGKRWAVRKSGAERVTRHFDTRQEALEAARRIARNQGGDVYIFGQDGRIRGRDSQVNAMAPIRRADSAICRRTTTSTEASS